MYVPGTDQRKMDKIPSLGVDTVVFDMEDGVAADQKVTRKRIYYYYYTERCIRVFYKIVITVL